MIIKKIMDFNYKKLGFKAGIEIHQELNTNKLFCNCSSKLFEEKLISIISRKLRAVAGETGDIDLASMYEQFRNRNFNYHSFSNESCLVELDEEPPHSVNKNAFDIAIGVAKLFKLNIADTICVMRKTVTDGSAVSGFQRTMLIATQGADSFIKTSKGLVKIEQLNLEEDASKIISKEGSTTNYSLSRLGIPLLEINTDPSLIDPQHVKETALLIGTYLRSFNVKRGIGTIRQDVNISIKGGARIEVKGWQDLKKIEELVKNEVSRQYNLLAIKKELKNRGLSKFDKNSKEVTQIFKKTNSKIILNSIKNNNKVYALVLPKFSGLLKKELCPNKTFGKELSEYAKAYGPKGMIHTDEDLSKYQLTNEFNILKKELKTKNEDLILIITEKEEVSKKAIESVYQRALYSLIGVPKETRIPNHITATSSYARPLPGAHRLYPETDIANIKVTSKLLNSIILPELLPQKIKRYSKEYNIRSDLAKELINLNLNLKEYLKYENIEPNFIIRTLIESPKEIKKRYDKNINILEISHEIFMKLDQDEINRDAIFEILVEFAHNRKIDYSKYKLLDEKELEQKIKEIISKNKGLPFNALIGKVMAQLRGKAPGKYIADTINKLMK